MSDDPIKILLVQEATAYLPALKESLEDLKKDFLNLEVVWVAGVPEAKHHLDQLPYDILILDMVQGQPLQGLIDIHQYVPKTPIIALIEQNKEIITQVLQNGSQNYLLRDNITSQTVKHVVLCSIERYTIWNQVQYFTQQIQNRENHFQSLIIHNPDGVVVVDTNGIVCFVNPAAEELFGHPAQEIRGEMFGFPIVAGKTTELEVFKKGTREPGIAEMRVVEIEWDRTFAYLISLRDITYHKKLQESLRQAEAFNRLVLESIEENIMVIDKKGVIISFNSSNEMPNNRIFQNFTVGENFFATHRLIFGETPQIIEGIQAVLENTQAIFSMEYRYAVDNEQDSWFHIRALPLAGNTGNHVVISLNDITERKRVAWAEAEAKSNATRIKEQEREIRGLLQLTKTPTNVTSELFGVQQLRESTPLVFTELTRRYGDIIEKAMEQRAYKVDYGLSDELRTMAERLGFLRAGPRDVVEIHSTVLQNKSSGAHPRKMQAYTEEGRLLVLELMGYLVSYYRNYSLGVSKTSIPQTT